MTPADVVLTIRNQVYETAAAFYTDAEIFSYMWQAECEIAGLVNCTETVYGTVTQAAVQQYLKPKLPTALPCLAIVRLTYDGVKLKKIDPVDQDVMDGTSYGGTLSSGSPHSYWEFSQYVYLYPVPSEAKSLIVYYIAQPPVCTAGSASFLVPDLFVQYIPDYCLYRMYAKDQDDRFNFHKRLWDENLTKAISKWRQSKRHDQHSVVKQEEMYPGTVLGMA